MLTKADRLTIAALRIRYAIKIVWIKAGYLAAATLTTFFVVILDLLLIAFNGYRWSVIREDMHRIWGGTMRVLRQ